jgi:hypothetical protein
VLGASFNSSFKLSFSFKQLFVNSLRAHTVFKGDEILARAVEELFKYAF